MTEKKTNTEKEATEEKKSPQEQLYNILKDIDGSPDAAQIDKWKQQYGDIFCSGFSEQEIYIFRALTRAEYKDIQVKQQVFQLQSQNRAEALQAQAGDTIPWAQVESNVSSDTDTSYKADEELVAQCLLWPKLTSEELGRKAGTVPALVEQIMSNSNFLTPQQAASLVIKL